MPFVRQLVRPLLAALALASMAIAQYSGSVIAMDSSASDLTSTASSSLSATKTSTSTGIATHTIQVGSKSDPHQYSPSSVKANVGDIVVFEFYPTNHSVVKADYLAPCVPASGDIFYSGMFDTFNEEDGQLVGDPPTWSLRINDTAPTFFYCTAIDSCLKNGMVGVINPNSSETFKSQYKKALHYPYMLVPGQSMPAEGEGTTTDTTSSATASATSSPSDKHGLSTGAIAGIAVAGVAFLAILVALFFVLGRNRVYSQWMSSQDGRTERTARWALFNSDAHSNGNRKSEMSSSTLKPGHIDISAVSSPDPNVRTFSPGTEHMSSHGSPSTQQGHWSWNEPPPPAPRTHIAPTELDGHPMIYEAPDNSRFPDNNRYPVNNRF
ncbi:hypothetical protein N7508_004867 [Penicillium antarcticum]|uniref:uncharacterized protein n=1 Tax=Penicillium antarcticum TaxID=416450 RepID=UPI0023853097|nr:uncharacterized protein N7508_004867 [Penicillium antarcticum]KAJ5305852.1 hypothetical protein N7508_004867 [Penicillium antarcticum]